MFFKLAPIIFMAALISACTAEIQKINIDSALAEEDLALLHRFQSNEIVILDHQSPLIFGSTFKITVQAVDGILIKQRKILLSTGQHRAVVRVTRNPIAKNCGNWICSNAESDARNISIGFTVRAGHEYKIGSQFDGKREGVWLENLKTERTVAIKTPSIEN